MLAKNLLPKPSPLLAPFTRPAISTISTVVGITPRSGLQSSPNLTSRSSGTVITPTLGSIVQNGKLADCAFALLRQLNNVDLPTLGSPTIPHFMVLFLFSEYFLSCLFLRYLLSLFTGLLVPLYRTSHLFLRNFSSLFMGLLVSLHYVFWAFPAQKTCKGTKKFAYMQKNSYFCNEIASTCNEIVSTFSGNASLPLP